MTPNPEMEAKHSTSVHKEIAENGLIIEVVAGSQLLGTNLDDSDHDSMGVCIEPPEYTLGLRHFEQYIGRSKPMGQRSVVGDTDRTIYSLRKFCSLALGGNPTILNLFYAPSQSIIDCTLTGNRLQQSAPYFVSRKAGKAFLGYMVRQRERLIGERGQMRVKRPELEAQHGYDTKYAGHIIRLGFQGIHYLTWGSLELPLPYNEREAVMEIRRGEWELNDVLTRAGEMEKELERLLETSLLPERPDYDAVNTWLVDAYIFAESYYAYYDFYE